METFQVDTDDNIVPSYTYQELADQGLTWEFQVPEMFSIMYGYLGISIYRDEIAGWIA